MRRRRLDPIGALLLLVTSVGMFVLGRGLFKAAPIIFFGTEEELRSAENGRDLMLRAAALLVVAGLGLAARRGWRHGLAVAIGPATCTALVVADLDSLALLGFIPAMGVTLGAALSGALIPRAANAAPAGDRFRTHRTLGALAVVAIAAAALLLGPLPGIIIAIAAASAVGIVILLGDSR